MQICIFVSAYVNIWLSHNISVLTEISALMIALLKALAAKFIALTRRKYLNLKHNQQVHVIHSKFMAKSSYAIHIPDTHTHTKKKKKKKKKKKRSGAIFPISSS